MGGPFLWSGPFPCLTGGNVMKKVWLSIILGAILILAACSSEDKKDKVNESPEEGVGFSLSGDSIEEAENIPDEAKEQILQAFDAYIEAFNQKDIDAYFETLSKDTESFDLEEERTYMEETFSENDLNRVATETTIVKYTDTEAQVFSKLKTSMKQLASGYEINPTGRQVTLFTKEEGEWKVAGVHYIGDSEEDK